MKPAIDRANNAAMKPEDEAHTPDTVLPVVFVVTQSARRANGGVESISQILEHLSHVKPIVVTQRETPANVRWRKAGCQVHVWKSARETLRTNSVLKTNLRMLRLLRSTGCRVVHCNDISALWNTAFGARLAGAAVVFNVRNIKPEEQRYGWRWRVAKRISDRQIVLSKEMQDAFARRLNFAQSNGRGPSLGFIYSAVDSVGFAPIDQSMRSRLRAELGIPSACFAIGYVAPLGERKAQLEFIKEAGPLLKRLLPRARTYFIGDFAPERNDYARSCEKAVDDLGLRDSMSFIGYTADIAEWYRALDVVVVASRNEGLARCMIESLACGTPVVSFDVCSAREILEEHGCGVVVPRGDYQELARQVAVLAERTELRERFAGKGPSVANQLFDPETIRAEYEQLYFSLTRN